MKNDPAYEKHLARMMALCSRSEKCKWDIRSALQKKGVKKHVVEQIIYALETHGFIDEKRYACAYVKDKIRLQGWGPVKIQVGLRSKNIPENILSEALESVDTQEYMHNLQAALERKQTVLKEPDRQKNKEKLIRFALGRGYTYHQIIQALEGLQENEE